MTRLAAIDRALLAVTGADRASFLQGLVSADIPAIAPGTAAWAALLTPQGKWLADFFVVHPAEGERLLLDCAAADAPALAARLLRFRLRAKVAIAPEPALAVYLAWDGRPETPGALVVADPRLPAAGWRLYAPPGSLTPSATPEEWDAHRLALGLPEGSPDLEPEQSVLLEAGFDELGGIAWSKGCWMGQELTARTKYRGLLKRRLVPVAVAGPLPPAGTPVLGPEGAVCGEMRSGRGAAGLALLRLAALHTAPLRCGEALLTPQVPAWMQLPATAD